jgi:hypothetical protein
MDDWEPSTTSRTSGTGGPTTTEVIISAAVTAAVTAIINALIENVDWDSVARRVSGRARNTARAIGTQARAARTKVLASIKRPQHHPVSARAQKELGDGEVTPRVSVTREEFLTMVQSILAAEAFAAWQRSNLQAVAVDEDVIASELLNAIHLALQGNLAQASEIEMTLLSEFLQEGHGTELGVLGAAPRELPADHGDQD